MRERNERTPLEDTTHSVILNIQLTGSYNKTSRSIIPQNIYVSLVTSYVDAVTVYNVTSRRNMLPVTLYGAVKCNRLHFSSGYIIRFYKVLRNFKKLITNTDTCIFDNLAYYLHLASAHDITATCNTWFRFLLSFLLTLISHDINHMYS